MLTCGFAEKTNNLRFAPAGSDGVEMSVVAAEEILYRFAARKDCKGNKQKQDDKDTDNSVTSLAICPAI
ncbi:MAG: hypothetical protein K0Q55_1965 [Verrucomicrobia bacterium]|nr:hypothetical protein [Verrucomicrobiota bacterium]